jgi:hypothetical protein
MVISGKITIENEQLTTRDAIGIYNTQTIHLKAIDTTQLLLIEVPMVF